MKLYIELSEEDVQIKIDELLGKRISEITDEFIEKKVSNIITTKLSRLDSEELMRQSARNIFIELFGNPKNTYNNKYNAILREEALKLLDVSLKQNGLKQN